MIYKRAFRWSLRPCCRRGGGLFNFVYFLVLFLIKTSKGSRVQHLILQCFWRIYCLWFVQNSNSDVTIGFTSHQLLLAKVKNAYSGIGIFILKYFAVIKTMVVSEMHSRKYFKVLFSGHFRPTQTGRSSVTRSYHSQLKFL